MNITKRAVNIKREWYLIDVSNKILGRVATEIVKILRGKNKVDFSPDADCGDNVIVINAEKIKLTGNKLNDKIYRWHTGYPGGLKERTAKEMLEKKPDFIIYNAVKGMLPKNKLRDKILKRLKIYKGEKHPHIAQKPIKIEI